MDNCLKRVLEIIMSAEKVQTIEQDLRQKKESISFLPEANPFGDDNLALTVDSVYLFRMITGGERTPLALGWLEFDPYKNSLREFSLGDTTELTFKKSLLKNFPLECTN